MPLYAARRCFTLSHAITRGVTRVQAAWLSVLNIERASYLRQYESGMLTREGFAVLENFMATMTARAGLVSADRLHDIYDENFHKMVDGLKKPLSKNVFYDRILAYHVAKAYITAQLDVKHSMQLYKRSEAVSDSICNRRRRSRTRAKGSGRHAPMEQGLDVS